MLRPIVVASLLLVSFAALAAVPADQIRGRVAGYRALGAAFKSANDAIRSGEIRSAQFQQSVSQIATAARNQYQWFPVGSGPQSRAKTAAKADIWSNKNEFRSAQDAFARRAIAFERVARAGGEAEIRAEARKLGAQCKSCQDRFRASAE